MCSVSVAISSFVCYNLVSCVPLSRRRSVPRPLYLTATSVSPSLPTGTPPLCVCARVRVPCASPQTRVCAVKIIYTNDMSMGNSTIKKSGGSQAASFTPHPDGHQDRLVIADAFTRAESVYSTIGLSIFSTLVDLRAATKPSVCVDFRTTNDPA